RDLLVIPGPELQIREELGFIVTKPGMSCFSRFSLNHGSVTRVLYGQGRSNDQHLRETLLGVSLEYHACQAGIDRQSSQRAPRGGQLVGPVQCSQLLKLLIPIGNRSTGGSVHKRKGFNVIQSQ